MCIKRCIFTLIAFVCLFFILYFQMSPLCAFLGYFHLWIVDMIANILFHHHHTNSAVLPLEGCLKLRKKQLENLTRMTQIVKVKSSPWAVFFLKRTKIKKFLENVPYVMESRQLPTSQTSPSCPLTVFVLVLPTYRTLHTEHWLFTNIIYGYKSCTCM